MGNSSFLLSSQATKEFTFFCMSSPVIFCYVKNVLISLTSFVKLRLLWELIYFQSILLETEYV